MEPASLSLHIGTWNKIWSRKSVGQVVHCSTSS